MREPEDMGWYAVTVEDGSERVMHAAVARVPEHARPISEQEARAISAALRIARGDDPAPSAPAAAVDLSGIHARLDAITSQVERVEGAVNDMTAGLTGEKME